MRSVPPSMINCPPSGSFFDAVTAARAGARGKAKRPRIKAVERRFLISILFDFMIFSLFWRTVGSLLACLFLLGGTHIRFDQPHVIAPTRRCAGLGGKLDDHAAIGCIRENFCWDGIMFLEKLIRLGIVQRLGGQRLAVDQDIELAASVSTPISHGQFDGLFSTSAENILEPPTATPATAIAQTRIGLFTGEKTDTGLRNEIGRAHV